MKGKKRKVQREPGQSSWQTDTRPLEMAYIHSDLLVWQLNLFIIVLFFFYDVQVRQYVKMTFSLLDDMVKKGADILYS